MGLTNILTAVGVAVASAHSPQFEYSLESVAAKVNAANTTWKAAAPTGERTEIADFANLCGTWLETHPNYERLPEKTVFDAVEVPASFDSRTQWPKCTVISKIRDQSACGSCWAFGSTESFEDRACIATGNDIEYSAYDTASNCHGLFCGFSMGCGGGQPGSAWKWMTRTGVVTGKDFSDVGTGSSCAPYPFETCAHHVNSTKYPACPKDEYSTKEFSACTEDKYTTNKYSDDKFKAKKSYSVSGIDNMKAELVAHGPMSVAFTVYADFPTYKSGVYKHVSGQALGGHAVELIGYGTESGTDYWLVKNSWNEQWGDAGTFKIAHGECGIENTVNGGTF